MTADHLGTDNAIVIAAVFSSVVVLGPLGGSLTGSLRATTAQRTGLIGFVIATAAILTTLHAGAIIPFLIVSVLASVCQGAANTGGMRAVLEHATPADRAGLLSTLFLISYSGAAVPGLVAGSVSSRFSLDHIALGYAALVLLASILAIIASRNPKRPAPEQQSNRKLP